jgi:hypothetical protein
MFSFVAPMSNKYAKLPSEATRWKPQKEKYQLQPKFKVNIHLLTVPAVVQNRRKKILAPKLFRKYKILLNFKSLFFPIIFIAVFTVGQNAITSVTICFVPLPR